MPNNGSIKYYYYSTGLAPCIVCSLPMPCDLYSVTHSIMGWSDNHFVSTLATESMLVIRFMMADIQVDCQVCDTKSMPLILPNKQTPHTHIRHYENYIIWEVTGTPKLMNHVLITALLWLAQPPQTNGAGKVTFQGISEPKQSIAKSKGVHHGNKQSKQTINFAMKQDNDTLLYNMYYSLVQLIPSCCRI